MYVGHFKKGISTNTPAKTEEAKQKQGQEFLNWVQKDGGEHTIQMASIVLKREREMRQLGYYAYRSATTNKQERWSPIQMLGGDGPEISHLSTKLDLLGSLPQVLLDKP